VLGSKSFVPARGIGWGTYKPREIFNDRNAAGMVQEIVWTGWGNATATGNGETYLLSTKDHKVTATLVPIQLRATDLGHCSAGSPLAYEQLSARAPSHPGGPMGNWSAWAGTKTVC
jgi:hypothetical protein